MVSVSCPTCPGLPAGEGGTSYPPCRLEHIPLPALMAGVRQEIAQYMREHDATSFYAFELFHRALVKRDEAAWVGLYDLYASLVASWILRFMQASGSVNLEALVNETFAKVAHALDARAFAAFPGVPAVLAYLKQAAASVVADEREREQRRAAFIPLSTLTHDVSVADPTEIAIEGLAACDLWRTVSGLVKNEAERLVLQEHLLHGVPPRALPHHYPQVFATTADVYRVKRNLLERLRRNHAVQAWRRER